MKLDPIPSLGLAHFTVLDVPPPALVDLAATTGYRTIGLRLYPAFPGAPFYEIPTGTAAMREMRGRLDATDIRVHDIEFVTVDADFVPARLAPLLSSAAELGARRVSVCGDDPDRARLIARFAELCALAAEVGMGVDLECMAWRQVSSLGAAVDVVRTAGMANGGVLVDALHLSRTGGHPADLDKVPAGMIVSAQLCDAPAVSPPTTAAIIHEARSGRLPPGAGELPLDELLARLPDGTVLSVEVPMGGAGAPDERARQLFRAARDLLEASAASAKGENT